MRRGIGMNVVNQQAEHEISLTVNGALVHATVPARMSLADFLRDRLHLTGTHLGCEQGICGACTILLDGRSARACLMLAVQANQRTITTVEGLEHDGTLTELQQAFIRHHALQCGFCTSGFLILATEFLPEARTGATLTRDDIRARLAANLCRCTGYGPMVDAVEEVLHKSGRGGAHVVS
ncbi:MAG: (2Fe-2S)-binding protein [Candidatus Binatia bacterium]